MAIGRGGIPKKGSGDQRFIRAKRTAQFRGAAEPKNASRFSNPKLRAIWAKKRAKWRKKAAAEILEFYQNGWPGFKDNEAASMTAIARTLLRKGIVTEPRAENEVKKVLKALASMKKITLPKKQKRGGKHKPKKK